MYEGILTFVGMKFLNNDIKRLENSKTKVVASPIPIPFATLVVTARVGHMPSNRMSAGFSLSNPLVK